MFKNMGLVIILDMFLNPSFRLTTNFLPIRLELQLAQVNLYTRKISNHQELGLYMKNNF